MVNFLANIKKYVNALTFMMIVNVIALLKITIVIVQSELNLENILHGYFVSGLPFILNIFMQKHIKRYESFYSRDILIILPALYIGGVLILGYQFLFLLFSGLS